jgi:hypothetical protein
MKQYVKLFEEFVSEPSPLQTYLEELRNKEDEDKLDFSVVLLYPAESEDPIMVIPFDSEEVEELEVEDTFEVEGVHIKDYNEIHFYYNGTWYKYPIDQKDLIPKKSNDE